MDSLYLLIPIALIFCVLAIKLLLWAIGSGQYDDLDKEAWRILADDSSAKDKQSGELPGDYTQTRKTPSDQDKQA